MSESDLVARTWQLLDNPNISPLPWLAQFTVHGDPFVVTDLARPTFSAVATVSNANDDYGRANCRLIAEGVSALPALLADNERLTTELAVTKAEAFSFQELAGEQIIRADAAESENAELRERNERLGLHAVEESNRADAAEAKVRAVERIHCWTNEDGRRFMFVDDVASALFGTSEVSETGDE